MADPLYELLAPSFGNGAVAPLPRDPHTTNYLARLNTLSLSDLSSTEPASLSQSAQSHVRNLQTLSKRSHRAVISSATHLTSLSSLLPSFGVQATELQTAIPGLESVASEFAQKYDRGRENAVLDRRKRAMLLSRNVDRLTDVLDLPSLLSSTVSAAQAGGVGASAASAPTSYASALDLHAHIRRLNALYPQSELVKAISTQFEDEMQKLATILITSLQSPSLKLAAAMRTVGLLRRVAPELAGDGLSVPSANGSLKGMTLLPKSGGGDGALGALFLICRLQTLHKMFEALDPLRELADQETPKSRHAGTSTGRTLGKPAAASSGTVGSQSEKYLKRYIDIFREQSFAILSMYKSIFPVYLPVAEESGAAEDKAAGTARSEDPLLPLPSSLSSFALHLVDMLSATLGEYVPNVTDPAARESLLTQVLYCAGSLGRLGAEFGMMTALLEADLRVHGDAVGEHPEEGHLEWVRVMKKHRVQASRLEILARGVGVGAKKSGMDVLSPGASASPVAAGV